MVAILVIEDDKHNAHLLAEMVKLMGHTCICLPDGDAALEIACQQQPALIILDMRLPGRHNGWQLARLFKQQACLRHIPILAHSVEVDPEDRARALAAGCDDYIPRPARLAHLRESIARCLATPAV